MRRFRTSLLNPGYGMCFASIILNANVASFCFLSLWTMNWWINTDIYKVYLNFENT
jgi:hypothetical protein